MKIVIEVDTLEDVTPKFLAQRLAEAAANYGALRPVRPLGDTACAGPMDQNHMATGIPTSPVARLRCGKSCRPCGDLTLNVKG